MKIVKPIIVILFFMTSFMSHAQIVVKVKPVAPRTVVMVSPARAPHGQVWINGHWVVKNNNYHWQDGYYVNHRRGYHFVEGHWKQNRHGWVWVPGKWKRNR